MPRARLLCSALLAFAFALGVFAVTATACEGGGGGPELTSLSTKLSGEGKEGEELTVSEGAKVKDKATLTGKNASKATGKVTYKLYSEKECKTLVTSAGEVTVSGESVPASSEEEPEAGKTYYWQAHYGGDSNNAESTSPCTEILNVKAKTSLSTKLSGEGSEGEELTILEGSEAEDKATLAGTNHSTATGKVLYKIYSEKECKTLVEEAGEVILESGAKIPASTEEELEGGKTYYWRATYKGDGLHQESTSSCGGAVLQVKAVACTFPYCEPTITPGVKLNIPLTGSTVHCTAGPIMAQGTERFLLTSGHCMNKVSTGTQTITQKVRSVYPTEVAGMTEKQVGETVTYNNTANYDIAEVKIENAAWLLAGGGAPPFLVEWEATPKVTPAVGKAANLVGEVTCISGAVSGLRCGRVLQLGVTKAGTKNLIETSVNSVSGDSGSPEFARITGGVLIQGTETTGEGSFAISGGGNLTNGSDLITGFPQAKITCEKIAEMKTMWTTAGVPVEGTGIPANTTVTECKEPGANAEIKMSAAATANGANVTITIGYTTLSAYEPMSQIEAVYTGQTLVVR